TAFTTPRLSTGATAITAPRYRRAPPPLRRHGIDARHRLYDATVSTRATAITAPRYRRAPPPSRRHDIDARHRRPGATAFTAAHTFLAIPHRMERNARIRVSAYREKHHFDPQCAAA